MRKLYLILNGKSAARPEIRNAVEQLRTENFWVDVRATWEGGDARRFAVEAARQENTVVVAGGGDGTVNEVLNGLMESNHPATMAILPLGTANDFATSAGIPVNNPYAALRMAAEKPCFAIDVGKMNDRCFLNVASGGFGAEVTAQTSIELKKAIGGAAYGLTSILLAMKAHPYHGRLITEEKTYEGSMVMMAVGNGRQAGGGAQMTPHAQIDDGLLDIMLIPDHEHARFAHLLTELVELKYNQSNNFHYLKLPKFTIESESPLQFNLDGEPVRGQRFEFSALPSAIRVVLPETSPLLRQNSRRSRCGL